MDQLATFFYPAYHGLLVGGFNLPLWKIMEFARDHDIPFSEWKVIQNSMVPNHQCQTTNQFIFIDFPGKTGRATMGEHQ